MRVGFLQCNVVHNREENICRVRDCLSKQDCDLLVLPELSVCGYLFPDRKALYECAEEIPTGGATCQMIATVYKGNIIKNLIMDCQSYTKYRPNKTTGGIFVSWRRKEELPTGA